MAAKKPAKKSIKKPAKKPKKAVRAKPTPRIKRTRGGDLVGICGYDFHNPREEKVTLHLCKYCKHYFCKDHTKSNVPEMTENGEIIETDSGHPCFQYLEQRKALLRKEIEHDENELHDLVEGKPPRLIRKEEADQPRGYQRDYVERGSYKSHKKIAVVLAIVFIAMAIGLALYALGYWPILFPQFFPPAG